MSLSPLAERIYQILLKQLRLPNPLISYGDLVRALGSLPAPDTDLKPNDPRLFEALGEIVRACQSNKPPLPTLSSIVVRRTADGSLGTPGSGYFAVVFPQIRDETARLQRWREEMSRVVACSYPSELCSAVRPGPIAHQVVPRSLPEPAEIAAPEELASAKSSRPTGPRVIPRWLHDPTVIAAVIGLAGTLLAVILPVWISTRRDETPQPRQADRVVVAIVPQSEKPSPPHQVDLPEEKNAPQMLTLDSILDVLERHHQRVTFGAAAGVLGRDPRSLFNGYVRTPRTAWVVNKSTGLPTGTKASDFPPGLLVNERVIDAPEELREWLREHR